MAKFRSTNQHEMNFARLQYGMSGGSVPPILNFGCKWSWVACFTSRVHYDEGGNFMYLILNYDQLTNFQTMIPFAMYHLEYRTDTF
jgi:hypothetical protein